MKVTELNRDQLDQLRMDYNYNENGSTAYVDETDIPDRILFEAFAGIEFAPDDFTAPDPDYFHNPSVDASEQLAPLPGLIIL